MPLDFLRHGGLVFADALPDGLEGYAVVQAALNFLALLNGQMLVFRRVLSGICFSSSKNFSRT
jgi:hypothetical protein